VDNNVLLPPGELIASNGSRYHVRRWGKGGPTVLLECGLTMMSSCWGWLAPELARTATVLAYDRAGLGWSEAREGLRDAGQLSKELSGLARALPIEGPVVLVGHSMGAMINRAYYRQNPRGISAMIWLDPAHPQGPPANRRMRNLFFFLLEFAHLLAARNLPSITLRIL
jgi:pimeloyl-ACP methyl ester carboxylesterase